MACAPSEDRSAWASAQSDQSLLSAWRCPGWSESSMGAHAILLVLSWGGSTVVIILKYSRCNVTIQWCIQQMQREWQNSVWPKRSRSTLIAQNSLSKNGNCNLRSDTQSHSMLFVSDFITETSSSTGILLDPYYTGKGAMGMVRELSLRPERFKGKRILFIHTGINNESSLTN